MVAKLHGTAQLLSFAVDDLTGVVADTGSSMVLLGHNYQDQNKGYVWMPAGRQGHALTFGATRSGKGVSTIIPALISYRGSMIVIDPKGENAWVTATRRRQLGHKVVILDPWGEVNRRYADGKAVEQTSQFNPLAMLDPSDPDFADDVAALADALIISQSTRDPHWDDSARELVSGLIAGVVEQAPGVASLSDVRKLLTAPADELQAAIKILLERDRTSLAASKLARFAEDSREIGSIRSTAITQTAMLDNVRLGAAMQTGDEKIDLADLARGKMTVYLVLPVDRLQTHGRWLRLILTLAIRACARQPIPPKDPVIFMIDEMGTIGRLAMIEQAFGLMAGLGIRLWGFLQDLNQLKRDYPEGWETFIANCSIIQVLNARDITTSKYFSDYLGNMTVEFIHTETAELRKQLKDPDYPGEKDKQWERPVLFPDELRRMSARQNIIIGLGYSPVRLYCFRYYTDPIFAGRYRALPTSLHKPVVRIPDPEPELLPTGIWGGIKGLFS